MKFLISEKYNFTSSEDFNPKNGIFKYSYCGSSMPFLTKLSILIDFENSLFKPFCERLFNFLNCCKM